MLLRGAKCLCAFSVFAWKSSMCALKVRVRSQCVCFFFYGNRLTALAFDFTPSHTWHTRANTHTQTHKESGRKVQCCPPSSFLWRCFFFSFPSLPDFLGGVLCPLCPKALLLYLYLFHSLCLLFMGCNEQKKRMRMSLSPGQGRP